MPVEVIMPKVDMDMTSGTIAGWHIKEGQSVEKGEPLFDIETDKATMEVESPASGALHFVSASNGDVVEIGKCVGWLFEEGEAVHNPSAELPKATAAVGIRETEPDQTPLESSNANSQGQITQSDVTDKVRATPLARRIAKDRGFDISTIAGTGPRGRITKSDVENHQISNDAAVTYPAASTGPKVSKEQLEMLGIAYESIPVDRMRQTIAARLTESKSTVPHFYLEADCRCDALMAFRAQLNETLLAIDEPKISINDMLVRACAQTLKAVPETNASWGGDEIIRYMDANVSVAVSIEGGLITPVVRQAQNKSLRRISEEVTDLVDRAKAGKLKPHEYQAGSFSISNLGMFGVKAFSAIVNPPESMILAVGRAERRFVEDENGNPVAATMMSVTLSCDHRVVDGALGARWLSEFRRFVEMWLAFRSAGIAKPVSAQRCLYPTRTDERKER
ncbi:MAG: dihydrolipoamide acetyltransferase family protein [Pseudomonadota bacterium]